MRRRGKRGIWQIRVGGVRQTSGTSDRERAKALQDKLNAEKWDRKHGLIVPTWDQANVSWIGDNPGPASKYHNNLYAKWWKKRLTGKRLGTITPKLIHDEITKKFKVDVNEAVPANATANGYVSFVGRIIRHGSNLHPKLVYYPKSDGRDRWLTVEAFRGFTQHMYPDLMDISTFALVTGLREANDMFFRWAWLHDNDTWALLPKELTKTKKPYGIPLNKTAQAVIKRRREATIRHPEFVFINQGKPWYCAKLCLAIKAAAGEANLLPFTFHGFRHTFASWLAQKGVSEAIRDRLGCWKVRGQGNHYAHFDVDSLRPFSELFDVILGTETAQAKLTA